MIITGEHFLYLIKKNKKLSETFIPKLIHRLIKETIGQNTYTRFPSDDDIFVPGFDGIVKNNSTPHRFLPQGNICFEIGVKTDCYKSLSKINDDYVKRKNDVSITDKENYSYIAITTSILNSNTKQIKCDKYTKEKIFKNVLILDAIDITSWMKEHINICIWFLQNYGEKIDDYDINLVSDEWDRISKATNPNLSVNIFTNGNESNSTKLIKDLLEIKENRIFTISSEYYGRDFAYSFCIASIISSENNSLIEKAIVVNSQQAMNYVNAFCKGKIVLVNFNCLDDRFALCLNNIYIFFDILLDVDIKLNMIKQNEFVKEVNKLGYSESEASKISFLVDYNVLTLRRLLTKIPSIKIPLWSKNCNKNELIPLLLMGEINMDKMEDIDFLKLLIGDDIDAYTEKLNLWSEMNQSPILKYGNIYRICSRKECFDFLQIDIFSTKLKNIEDKMSYVLSDINNTYKKEYDIPLFNYKRIDRLIDHILDGFIILSEKNKNNQIHFDTFVENVFKNLYGKYDQTLALSQHFTKLCELSPSSFISFLQKLMTDDKDNLSNLINTKPKNAFTNNNFINCILWSLEIVLKNENYALIGFEILLDFYYLFDDKILFDFVIRYLSPLATMAGLISIPFSKKIDFFFNYIEKKEKTKTLKIIDQLNNMENDSIMIGTSHSYRNYDMKKIEVTYQEIFDMKSKTFNWLVENQNDTNELVKMLIDHLKKIHHMPTKEFKEQLCVLEDKLCKSDDEVKAKAYREVLRTREKILKFENWKDLKIYIPTFDDFLKKIKPLDNYILQKYILIDDNYPLLDPPLVEESNWYEKTIQLREQEKKDTLNELINKNGQSIIEKIIKDCLDNSFLIWPLIYDISDNHLRDFKFILDNKLSNGLRFYMKYMNEQEIDEVLEMYGTNKIVIQNLPFSKKIYKWIDGNKNEQEYWKNQYFDHNNKIDFEYLFEKFITFAPEKLIGACSYIIEIDYKHSLRLLNAISDNISINSNEIDSIQTFVKNLDQKYYTDELSLCEFKLLPILKNGIEDYPMGIKKYFWDHPDQLGSLLIQLNEQKDSLPSNSLGKQLLFDAIFSFGRVCYIPSGYITQKRDNIKAWVDGVLSVSKNKNTESKILLKHAIINTLVTCPKQITDNVWPIKEVADILEDIAKEDFESKDEVSSSFYAGYTNKRDVRNVNDGSLEFSLSEEFKKYKEYYQFSHPVTSKALEFISEEYNQEANADKDEAYLGHK